MRLLSIIIVLVFATLAFAGPPAPPPSGWTDNGTTTTTDRSVVVTSTIATGEVVSEITTEYKVWEVKDSNGDVVASCVVTCSVITDGSQVCEIKYYVMSDTAGSLTNEFSVNVDSD